ncbi:GtrA family protein [Komagataeibacter sp. AV436]|uniref:GtrA family protein n=1 Tax=Komagataeibacter melomenusus TaxID=2766578 RepID=A0ABX2AEA6_9PROT|nr:GtrA family protein [Komagataeibacter melomenusus]NPC66387.1 GtrA family protein [Komagataeibacter melomenusus]
MATLDTCHTEKEEISRDIGEFIRYFLCSVFSLGIDIGSFSFAIHFLGIHWAYAAGLGFILGSITAYLGSIFWVFKSRRMKTHQNKEFFLFLIIGICGLLLCELTLWVGINLEGFQPEITRVFASILTFIFNFVVRKIILF